MSKFRKAILTALARLPDGYMQRIDGLRCERGVIETEWLFFGIRLYLMERAGLIRSAASRSFWPSSDGLPMYCLTPKGLAAIAKAKGLE